MKPTRFGVLARMFEGNTISYLTEALGNIFYKDYKKTKFQSINTLMYEWQIETNEIKHVALAEAPVGDGANGCEITMSFTENYYNMNDTFELDGTKQQFFVVSGPIRRSDSCWECQVRIISDNYDEKLEGNPVAGDTTRWVGNAFPELHEYGFIKYQSNTSKFRNYISTIRVDDSQSSLYSIHEDMFIKLGKGEGSSEQDKEQIYKLDSIKANLMKNFNEASNNMMLLSRGNVTAEGRIFAHAQCA